MTWTTNGFVHYRGTQNQRSGPPLQASPQQLAAANPGWGQSTTQPVWDPRQEAQSQNTRDQMACVVAEHAHISLALNASGDLVEAPAQAIDNRITNALQGRTPKDQQDLDQWLKEADPSLTAADRMALAMQYEATFGPLMPLAEATKAHTLGSLGLRKASRMTQTQFAERLRYHQVPQDQHMTLAFLAYEGGHIVPEDEEQGITFQPSVTRAAATRSNDEDPSGEPWRKKMEAKATTARLVAHVFGTARRC
jgi:hypothetical protein